MTQSLARCLRIHRDKGIAIVILPQEFLNNKDLIKNLIVIDPRLKNPKCKRFITLGNISDKERSEINKKLTLTLLKSGDTYFDFMIKLCKDYMIENNKNYVPARAEYNRFAIGNWIDQYKQKIRCNSHYKPPSEIELSKLRKLSFFNDWMVENINNPKIPNIDKFTRNIDYCRRYLIDNNTNTIPTRAEYKGEAIGKWFDYQKHRYDERIGCSVLNEYELNELNTLECFRKWVGTPVIDPIDKFNTNILLCQQYMVKTGKNTISIDVTYNEVTIGRWIDSMRGKYVGYGNSLPLTEYQLVELRKFPFWVKWEKKFMKNKIKPKGIDLLIYNVELCKKYLIENKRDILPRNTPTWEINLGQWIDFNKRRFKGQAGKPLTEEELNILRQLPLWVKWEAENIHRRKYEEKI